MNQIEKMCPLCGTELILKPNDGPDDVASYHCPFCEFYMPIQDTCQHDEDEDCMFCAGDCDSGCREDLNDNDLCPDCAPTSIMFNRIAEHLGHDIEIAMYGGNLNVAIECLTCNCVLIDYNCEEEK